MTTDPADLTVAQKVLLGARRLEDGGQKPFTAEALTVSCWRGCPRTFGLRGFDAEHPDNNKVMIHVMGEKGLCRRGWLLKVGQKLYELSRQGREETDRLLAGDEGAPLRRRALARIKVPKDLEQQLVALFTTTAFRRHEEGMGREITFRDACSFWGLYPEASGDTVDAVLGRVPATLAAVEQLLVGDAVELSNGQSVSRADLRSLAAVHRFLTERFSRNLHQQRARRGRP